MRPSSRHTRPAVAIAGAAVGVAVLLSCIGERPISKRSSDVEDDAALVDGSREDGGSFVDGEPPDARPDAGSLDTTFGDGGIVTFDMGGLSNNPRANTLAVQPDDKILVGGYATAPSGSISFAVVRFDSEGVLDENFGTDGKIVTDLGSEGADVRAIAVQPDGKIVAAGSLNWVGSPRQFAVVRYNPNGELDTTFGKVFVNVSGGTDTAKAVVVDANGRIVVSGDNTMSFLAVRLDANGALDTSFGGDGKVIHSFGETPPEAYANDLALARPGDDLVLGGGVHADAGPSIAAHMHGALVRFDSTGTPVASFGQNGRVFTAPNNGPTQITAVATQPDGKIVALLRSFDVYLGRYATNGALDPDFGVGGVQPLTHAGTHLVAQEDGKIVVVGTVADAGADGGAAATLFRYGSRGQLDTQFANVGLPGAGVPRVVRQKSGRYVVLGEVMGQPPSGQKAKFVLARIWP